MCPPPNTAEAGVEGVVEEEEEAAVVEVEPAQCIGVVLECCSWCCCCIRVSDPTFIVDDDEVKVPPAVRPRLITPIFPSVLSSSPSSVSFFAAAELTAAEAVAE